MTVDALGLKQILPRPEVRDRCQKDIALIIDNETEKAVSSSCKINCAIILI